jgi:hypothetical protein
VVHETLLPLLTAQVTPGAYLSLAAGGLQLRRED